MVKTSRILSGIAGEYLAAGELARHGYTASITLKNTKGIDILVTNEEGNKFACIQVKTNTKKANFWLLSKKDKKSKGNNFYYAFVTLEEKEGKPSYYVVPSKIVAERFTEGKGWYSFYLKKGDEKYFNNWGILRLE